MYYLRKEPYTKVLENAKEYTLEDRAIYKSTKFSRFYRECFYGLDNPKLPGLKIYTCKTLKRIKELQKATYDYCGEIFDIYDENGKCEQEDLKNE